MKKLFRGGLAAFLLVVSLPSAWADFRSDVTAVSAQVAAKFKAKTSTAADLADSLKTINSLIATHLKDADRQSLARLYLLDAHIQAAALDDQPKAQAIWEQVIRDFPGSLEASAARTMLDQAEQNSPDPQVAEGLEVGMKFPGFNETDSTGQPLSLAAYKHKVVLIDFWATWCGPCKAELPNVIAVYQRYHNYGFEIIGVSLDSDRDELANFTQAQGMAWPQYFDGSGWQNKLAAQYKVNSIPATYLLDRHGVIIGKGLRGEALANAVAKALAAK